MIDNFHYCQGYEEMDTPNYYCECNWHCTWGLSEIKMFITSPTNNFTPRDIFYRQMRIYEQNSNVKEIFIEWKLGAWHASRRYDTEKKYRKHIAENRTETNLCTA